MKTEYKIQLHFLPDERRVYLKSENESILGVALRNKISISHTCGGNATCGTCLVVVEQGLEELSSRNEWEQEMADERGYNDNERLACQTTCKGNAVVRVLIKD